MGKPSGATILHVGAYITPIGVFTFCVHLEPTGALGLNSQIWLVEATLMSKPPNMYRLLLSARPSGAVATKPPGKIVPELSPGQLSPPVRVVMVSATGS